MSNFNKPAQTNEVSPDLTQDEREAIITALHETYQFNLEALMDWLPSLRTAAFWALPASVAQNYSPAIALYLKEIYPANGQSYEEEMQRMAGLMLEARNDSLTADAEQFGVRFSPVMDAALMLLAGQIAHLKVLHELDKDSYQGKATTLSDVQFMAEVVTEQPTSCDLGQWVTQWVDYHLRYFAGKYCASLPASKKTEVRDDTGSGMCGLEPSYMMR